MSRPASPLLLSIAASLAASLAAVLITGLLLVLRGNGALTAWHRLPQLPDRAMRLVGANDFSVYVSSAGGSVYVFDIFQEDLTSWRITPWPVDYIDQSEADCPNPFPMIPDPPGFPIQIGGGILCGADNTVEGRFALLDDGSVWYWRQGISSADLYSLLCALTFACLSSLLFMPLAYWFLMRRRSHQISPRGSRPLDTSAPLSGTGGPA